MAVVDASVLVEYLAAGPRASAAHDGILGASDLWAPHLVDAEVGHVLRRLVRTGAFVPERAAVALTHLAMLPIRRVAHTGLLERAWALRETVSFYDALYVALAERLETPVLTFDARLSGAPGIRAEIVVLV